MTIHEKLIQLLELANKSAVSRKAGIPYSSLERMLARRSNPTACTAAKLARALSVDVGWLVDDTRGWPPVRVESTTHLLKPTSNTVLAA